jgi:hypothetical protein
LHLQGYQSFPQGRTGDPKPLSQFSFSRKTTAGRELPSGNQRADLIGDLQVKATRLNGLNRHREKMAGTGAESKA